MINIQKIQINEHETYRFEKENKRTIVTYLYETVNTYILIITNT